MDWNIHASRAPGRLRLVPVGELDLVTAPLLSRALREAEQQSGLDVVLDLSELSFMDSSGLAAVLEAVQRSSADGMRLSITPGEGAAARVLELADVLEDLPLERT